MDDGIMVDLLVTHTNLGKVIMIGSQVFYVDTMELVEPDFWPRVTVSGTCGSARAILRLLDPLPPPPESEKG